jgi:hypothetical protein
MSRLTDQIRCPECKMMQDVHEHGEHAGKIVAHQVSRSQSAMLPVPTGGHALREVKVSYACPASLATIELVP